MEENKTGTVVHFSGFVTDPATGREITMPLDAIDRLETLESQLVFSHINISLVLKTIRDEKYYLLRDYECMQDYCVSCLHMSASSVKRYLALADRYSADLLKKLSNSNISISKLLLENKNNATDGDTHVELEGDIIVYSDGTREQLDSFLSRIEKKPRVDKEISIKLEAKDTIIRSYEEKLGKSSEKIERLEKTVQHLVEKKDIDPSTVTFITQKREACDELHGNMQKALEAMGCIDNIPRDLVDAELAGFFMTAVTSMEIALERLKNNWFVILNSKTKHAKDAETNGNGIVP
jgi:hypothetical protein